MNDFKFGIILAAYNSSGTIDSCLRSWIEFQKNNNNLEICAISLPFEEYKEIGHEEDNTAEILVKDYNIETITQPRYIKESDARTLAYNQLIDKGCDYVWILDADEIYTEDEISGIIRFVSLNEFVNSFNINFKNYVFDGNCWIDGFCPPRIFKTNGSKGFYWDNDMVYSVNDSTKDISYKNLSQMVIPKRVAHVKHLTWINNETTKNKIKYQEKHFNNGAGCSYKWNDQQNCLEFNEEYFKKTGETIPKLNFD